MTKIPLWKKFASVEADLASAAALGTVHLHAEVFKKFAELGLDDPADIEAVIDSVIDTTEDLKTKMGGLEGPSTEGSTSIGPQIPVSNHMRNIALGALLAGPVVSAGKYVMGKYRKERGWNDLVAHAPDVVGQNPGRAKMIYDLLHDTAPSIATNPGVASDLTRQMMSMPQIDMGTIKGLSDISKNMRSGQGEGGADLASRLKDVPGVMLGTDALMRGMKTSNAHMILAEFKKNDGSPCVFNWGTQACKEAGITDAFSGSGTTMDQANNAFQANQQEVGNTLLPLDTVVRELLGKEQELAQREEMIQQQEAQLQEAIKMVQQMGSVYQDQSGVDPNTGEPAAPAAPEAGADPAQQAMPAEEAPIEEAVPEEAPAEEAVPEEAPAEEAPSDEPVMSPEEQDATQGAMEEEGATPQETAQTIGEANYEEAQSPPSAEEEVEAPADEEHAPDASAEGETPANASSEEGPPEGVTDEDSEEESTPSSEESEEASPEEEEAPLEESASSGPPQLPQQLSPEEEAAAGQTMVEQTRSMPPSDENPAGGETDTEETPEQPAEDVTPAEGDAPPPVAEEAEEGASNEEEETPIEETSTEEVPGETEEAIPAEAEPETPESIEGSVEDQAHDAVTGEDTPEDEAADAALAGQLNQTGQAPTPAAPPIPGEAVADPLGGGASPVGADGTISKTINVPVNIPMTVSIKLGEIKQSRVEKAKAFENVQALMSDLFRP